MIIEIGTSDFRTQAGVADGIFIEPVIEYFDRLPDNCIKENVAISDYEGEIEIYYIPSEIIKKHNLPYWLRGCNSVNSIHPTISNMRLQKYVVLDKVKVVRIRSIIKKHNVTEIDVLKIDTEGHDCVILNDFLDTVDILPNQIQFENNVLSDEEEVNAVCERLIKLDYKCTQVNFDMICKLCK